MPSQNLNETQQRALLDIARRSIEFGLQSGRALPVDAADFDKVLRSDAASFVTIHERGELRGCIGALKAYQPLVADVAEHAYAAAFTDPRFPPVAEAELARLEISISVLGEPEPMHFTSEADLLHQLRPGQDGLILEDGRHRGTFLPSVWESLPEPRDFWRHLKLKASLPADHWSDTLKVSRYTTFSFAESSAG
jgi:AmmeMemoRadiSam system protein A